MSPTDTTTDPGVDEELVVTILTRTTATASDGYLITAHSPSALQVDVLDYARHVARTQQVTVPLTVLSPANGTEAHVVVDPDGAIYADPGDDNDYSDADPGDGYSAGESSAAYSDTPQPADTAYADDTEVDDFYGAGVDAPAPAPAPAAEPPSGAHPDDGDRYADAAPETYDDDTPVTDTTPAAAPPAPGPRRAPARPAPSPPPSPSPSPSPYEAQTQQFPAYTDTEPASAPPRTPAPAAPSRRRGVRELVGPLLRPGAARTATAVAAAAVIAAGAGFYLGTGHGSSGTARPLDTYSGSGPGDTTSGPGAIFALNYAEYVYPRTLDGVRAVWPTAPADTIGPYLASVDAKTTHRLDITATSDPMTYAAGLTITPADGQPERFAQRYHLTRTGDGKYRVVDVTPPVASDDPITGTDPQAAASAVPTTPAAAAPAQNTCPASTSGPVTTGNGPGGNSGAGVIEKFDYAYYVQRDATAAREVVDPSVRAQIAPTTGTPDRPSFDTSITALPTGTAHCLRITDTGRDTPAGRRFTVALTESRPGSTPSLSNQTIYVKGALITALTNND